MKLWNKKSRDIDGNISEEKVESSEATKKKEHVIALSPSVVVFATYLLLLLSKVIDLTLLNRENEYFSVVILQMMIFLLPGIIWCRFNGEKFTAGLRIRMPLPASIPLMISGAFLLASGIILISILFGGIDSLSGSFSLYETFVSKDTGSVSSKVYLVMAYAVLPAICEEFVYRGILCREYENGGVLRAVLLSSLFFACLHFDLRSFPVYFFAGVILALTLYATRSLIGAMITHFLYNLFGLFGQPYMNTLYSITGSSALFVFVVAFVFLISAAIFCGCASRLYKTYLYKNYSSTYRGRLFTTPTEIKTSYLTVLKDPFTIASLAVYIIALFISWL